MTGSGDPSCKPNIVCRSFPEGMTRTDTTSDKVFYVGRSPVGPTVPPATPPQPSMGDAF